MIGSFSDRDTQKLYSGERVKRFSGFYKIALRKLDMLNATITLQELRIPPGNRLEAHSGNRKGQYSIRINDQWRWSCPYLIGHLCKKFFYALQGNFLSGFCISFAILFHKRKIEACGRYAVLHLHCLGESHFKPFNSSHRCTNARSLLW